MTDALELLSPFAEVGSLVAATVAVLVMVPQSAASVVPVTGITRDAPAASVPNVQASVPVVIAQPSTAGLMAQVTPGGNGSFTFTPVALPSPALETVIVKEIGSPALIVPAPA